MSEAKAPGMWGVVKGFLRWRKTLQDEASLLKVATGFNSTVDVDRNSHIVVLDYDITDRAEVVDSVKELQEFWRLSDAFVFQTKNGHHVLFFYDQVPYERLRMIIDFAKGVDPMFKYVSKFYFHKTLRARGKHEGKGGNGDIRFVCLLPGKRKPSKDQRELGEMKRREHAALVGSEYAEFTR